MGLTLQFAIGKAEQIIEAVKNDDFDYLDQLESLNRRADFSLHLQPKDLDTLVNLVTSSTITPINSLREYLLFEQFCVDEPDKGAIKVSPVIIQVFALQDESNASLIAKEWYRKMAENYPDEEIEYSEDGAEAVRKMISICKLASFADMDLIHIWYL